MVFFLQSGIRSQECPSFHESYDIFFRGLEDWQTKSTNAMTQICSTQRLIFDFALLDHRRTDLSRFSRTFFAGTNHFFIKPRAFQQAEAEATARADWPTWSLVDWSWGWVSVDWLIMITASSFLFRYHMQKKLRGCSPQSFNTKLSAHLRGRRIRPSGSRLNVKNNVIRSRGRSKNWHPQKPVFSKWVPKSRSRDFNHPVDMGRGRPEFTEQFTVGARAPFDSVAKSWPGPSKGRANVQYRVWKLGYQNLQICIRYVSLLFCFFRWTTHTFQVVFGLTWIHLKSREKIGLERFTHLLGKP